MRRTVLALCLTIAFTGAKVSAIAYGQAPTETVRSLVAEARANQARGDFAAAAESYRKAVAMDPAIPELWANLGLMYHESGKHDEAIRSFQEAIERNPSLFVPQLFLGLEYLESNQYQSALPLLAKAEKLNPGDLQAALNLGKAYALLDRPDKAADAYLRATRLAPNDGNTWLNLGMAYLQQVENDARLMTSTYSHSPYVNLRIAETLAEEGRLIDAENAYRSAIGSAPQGVCAHAEFGVTLLREKKTAEAREQFETEIRSHSHCCLALLGIAVAEAAEGHPDLAVSDLAPIAAADAGFVASNLHLFRDALSVDQARSVVDFARTNRGAMLPSVDLGSIVEQALLSETSYAQEMDAAVTDQKTPRVLPTDVEKLYKAGRFTLCDQGLKPELNKLNSTQQQLLASCSFSAGDFATTALVAEQLKAEPATLVQGLYWETKADQKLAIAALNRAGEIDADSPRMHALLGDIFRQKRRWDDAETEYRKAVALDPKSHAARLSLAIVLFSELKSGEALEIDRNLLSEDADDPEAELLAGEILVQRNLYTEAEPYLSKCQNLKPEFVPHLHALLGQVYAATDRIPAAISEYKAGLATDEDGSIHYRLGRLYQKAGDKAEAEEAFSTSKRLRNQWDERAHVALEQNSTDMSHQ